MLPLILMMSFTITYLCTKKNKNIKRILLYLNTPFVSLLFLTCLIGNDFSRGLSYILFVPLSSILGYLYFKFQKYYIPILSFFLFIFLSQLIYPNLYSYLKNNKSEKNIIFPKTTFFDNNKNIISINNNKIIVLDFWSTSCSICFKKFPDLENIYLKYENNPNIEIYAVNVPEKNDNFDKTVKLLDSIGYTFPKLYAKSAKEIKVNLNVYSFPHLLILKNGKIRYDGVLETDKKVMFYNTENAINKLLNE